MDKAQLLKYLGSEDPITILKNWIHTAQNHPWIKEPSAMVLCTVDLNQISYSRIVLAKEITERGIVFYTNTTSPKGRHLESHSHCSCLFYWDPLFRQVSVRGLAERMSRQKAINYWKLRPRSSQLSQWISRQSSEVENRDVLVQAVKQAEEKFKNQVPCPQHWSGYHVVIQEIEFWIGRDHRLHDRFLFSKNKNASWMIQRLYP